jgi:transposase-like protein
MFNTSQNNKMVEVLSGPERRRRRTPQEKIAIIQQTMEPGMTVSHLARLHGINANQIFKWCRQYEDDSLTAVASGEEVVPASEPAAVNIGANPRPNSPNVNKTLATPYISGVPCILRSTSFNLHQAVFGGALGGTVPP